MGLGTTALHLCMSHHGCSVDGTEREGMTQLQETNRTHNSPGIRKTIRSASIQQTIGQGRRLGTETIGNSLRFVRAMRTCKVVCLCVLLVCGERRATYHTYSLRSIQQGSTSVMGVGVPTAATCARTSMCVGVRAVMACD